MPKSKQLIGYGWLSLALFMLLPFSQALAQRGETPSADKPNYGSVFFEVERVFNREGVPFSQISFIANRSFSRTAKN